MIGRAGTSGIVLAGAAALGAYEVGVLRYLVEKVLPETGGAMPDRFAGTSAGAINAAAMAAFMDEPAMATQMLTQAWTELELGRILRPSSVELLAMALDVAGAPARVRRALTARSIRGGLFDARPIARLIERIPVERIAEHVRAGRLRGIALTATRVANGAAIMFYDGEMAAPTHHERNVVLAPTHLRHSHVRASAAIPLLFAAVTIDGEAYCDGGLRQIVPLSPVVRFGAERLLVVNPLPAVRAAAAAPAWQSSPLYLAGKALNALFADRLEADLSRLTQTNAILRAGHRRFGPTFEAELNRELVQDGGAELRVIDAVTVEPSVDLGVVAADFVSRPSFAVSGAANRLMRWIADGDPQRAGDLLAYFLFDGRFASELIELGHQDAATHHTELCALVEPHGADDDGPHRVQRRSA